MLEGLAAEDAEPDFDLVEPACVRRCEVEVHVRMAGEPEVVFRLVLLFELTLSSDPRLTHLTDRYSLALN